MISLGYKDMKVALVVHIPVLKQGGVEVVVRTLIEEFATRCKCYLISPDDPEQITGSSLQDLLHGHLQAPKERLNFGWLMTMRRWLHDNHIDLCHFHFIGTYDMGCITVHRCPVKHAVFHGFPAVVTDHQAVSPFGADRPSGRFLRKCAIQAKLWPGKALQLSASACEVHVSKHDLEITRRIFPFHTRKLLQLYHSRLDATTASLPHGPSRRILNVATIAFRKGQHILVEGFSRVAREFPDWSLDLVGFKTEDACIALIEKIIRQNGLEDRIHLHGAHSDPNPFLQQAEIYVQPSLLEGLGLSLQEAMFHGRACIGSETGGIPELIHDPSVGLLCHPGDPDSLASALSRLMADEKLRLRLGHAARTSILDRGMTRQAMAESYLQIYHQALQS